MSNPPIEIPNGLVELPFRYENGLILFDALCGGLPCVAEFDSCTIPNAVAHEFATTLGLKPGLKITSTGIGGDHESELVVVPEVAIDGLVLRDLPCHRETLGGPAAPDLMIGEALVRNAVVELDYSARRARIFSPERWTPPAPDPALAMFRYEPGAHDVPVLTGGPFRLNGRVEAEYVLPDTGNNAVLLVAENLARELGLRQGRPGVTAVRAGGYGGETTLLAMALETVALGAIEVEGLTAHALCGGVGKFFAEPGWVNIGNGLLSHFVVTFALPRGLFVLDAR